MPKPYIGNLLVGELRGKPTRTYTDNITGQKTKASYLRLLCVDDYNEEAFEDLRVPDELDITTLEIGTVYAFPVSQYVDRKTNKLRRSLRPNVPVFPAPVLPTN